MAKHWASVECVLPQPILVDREVLGERWLVDSSIGHLAVMLPRIPDSKEPVVSDAVIGELRPPVADHVRMRTIGGWGELLSHGPAWLRCLLFEYPDDPNGHAVASGRFDPGTIKFFSELLDGLYEWLPALGVLVGRQRHRSVSAQISVSTTTGSGWGTNLVRGATPLIGQPFGRTSADLDVLMACVSAGLSGRLPPLSHRLLVASEDKSTRGDNRSAVIDAATAVEVALTARLRRHAGDNMRAGAVDAILAQARGLDDLIKMGSAIGGWPAAMPSQNRVRHQLAHVRNQIVHQGKMPTEGESMRSIKLARAIVDLVDPLEH